MNRKERIIRTVERKEVDCTPFHIDMTSFLRIKVADYFGIKIDQLEQKIGNHLLHVEYQFASSYKQPRLDKDLVVDEFGVTWNIKKKDIGDWGMIDYPLKQPDISKINWPNPYETGRFDHLKKLSEENSDRFIVLNIAGIFDTCWHIRGFENFLMDMVLNQVFVNEMMDKAVEFITGLIETFPLQVNGIRFVEDFGMQKGLLFGKKYWDTFLKPRLKKVYGAVRKREVAVMVHSCGDIQELIPELIELGVDILDPIQPEVMDIKNLKKKYGKYLTFFGGVGCQSTMPKGSPKDIRKEVKSLHKTIGKGGGYIIGPAGAMAPDVPVENVAALIEICQKICPTF